MSILISELIEFHNECEYLDFKREEYNEQNKANLIKDVLAFANADTEHDRFIIMGVEKTDGKVLLNTVSAKYDSANIQQYVLDNITPELDISYFSYEHQGSELLVLKISDPVSQPYMTSKHVSFKSGKILLKENECWIRKGSFQRTASRSDLDRMFKRTSKKESAKKVKVTFGDGSGILNAAPKFVEQTKNFRLRPDSRTRESGLFIPDISAFSAFGYNEVNESFICFEINVHNVALASIEEYKLLFEFSSPVQYLSRTNVVKTHSPQILSNRYVPTTFLSNESSSGVLEPKSKILVGDDIFRSEKIYLKPFPLEHQLTLNWKLISKDYQQKGELKINVDPFIEKRSSTQYVKSNDEVRTIGAEIIDCIKTCKNVDD